MLVKSLDDKNLEIVDTVFTAVDAVVYSLDRDDVIRNMTMGLAVFMF